ncbi:TonB-dependent receptor domain-containing protein, partial [Bacteroidota bacterium]
MKARKYILILFLALVFIPHNAQESDVIFSCNLQDASFPEFVRTVEQKTGASFFFLEKWIKGLKISISGEEISLRKTLSSVLPQAGLHFYIREDLQVFITPEQYFITTLPDYSAESASTGISPGAETDRELTNIEQRYIEGRKAGLRETIEIGPHTVNTNQSGAVVYGKMVNRESGEPLIGATIYVQELKKGAVTDVDGRFSIVLRPGKYTVDFSCMGMETEHYYLDVHSGGNLDIFMDKGLIPLTEVVIEANRFHNVRGTQMGFERLNYKTVKEIPVVLGEKDLLKVAQMLPGVQNVGEGASGFNVRGSAADQNMIYVKKVPVYNSSHLFGFFSFISPDIVKDFSLYKSNLPANYGGRLASFFDITTRQGNMNEYTARGGISPITGHVAVEGPIVKNKSAFVLSARSTYSDWMLKQMDDPELRNSNASFYDLAGTLTWEPNKNNLLKTFGYYSKDKFSLGATNNYEYSNAGASIDLNHRFNSRISGDLAAVFAEYAFQTVDETVDLYAYSQDYRIDHYEMKADFTWLSLGAHKLSFGGNAIFYRLDRGYIEPYGEFSRKIPVNLGVENALETALYFADEFTVTPRITLYGGLRYSYYLALGPAEVLKYVEGLPKRESNITETLEFNAGQVIKRYSGPEPRIAINYLLGSDNSVKFSYNRVRQYLFMLSNTIAI